MDDPVIDAWIQIQNTRRAIELRVQDYETGAYYASLYLKGMISFERAQTMWDRIDARQPIGFWREG